MKIRLTTTLLSLLALFFCSLSQGALRQIDISGDAGLQLASDISKQQPAEFVENVKALRMGDRLVIKTASRSALTGTVCLCYIDVNFVEVRAGFLDDRVGHFRLTWDDDAMKGIITDTLKPETYDINLAFDKKGPIVIERLDQAAYDAKYPLQCGVGQEEGCSLSEAPVMSASQEDQKDDPAIWNDDVMVTQKFLVIYVTKARIKAQNYGGINNYIAQGLALGNLVLMNGGVHTRLVLTHSEEVSYECVGNGSPDLSAFNSGRPPFEHVRTLQFHYGADFRTFVPDRSDVGGLACVASTASGLSNRQPYHLIHVDYMTGHSWIHEIGHNMGGQHAIEQDSSAGPKTGGLFGHSCGTFYTLRGDSSYGSVMAYAGHRTDNFSDTNFFIEGTPLGADGRRNVARTWQKIRKYASNYRMEAAPCRVLAEESFDYAPGSSLMWQSGGQGFSEPWWTCSNGVFTISQGGLSYPGLHSAGGALLVDGLTSNGIFRLAGNNPEYQITRSDYDPGWPPLWISFLLCRQNDDPNWFGFKLCRMAFRKPAGDDHFYVSSSRTDFEVRPGETNLFVVKIDFANSCRMYCFVNPALDHEPSDDEAIGNVRASYSDLLTRFHLETGRGPRFLFDELRMAWSWSGLVAGPHPQAPEVQAAQEGLLFTCRAGAGDYDIYRGLERDGSDAVLVATVPSAAGLVSYLDQAPVAGRANYYMAAPQGAADPVLFTMPVGEAPGRLEQSFDPGSGYVVGQGQTNLFAIAGWQGFRPAFRWQVNGEQSQFKTNRTVFAYAGTMIPGEYPVTVKMRDTVRPYDGIVTNYTQLTVTNSYPGVRLELRKGQPMAGDSLTMSATVWDPGAKDSLEVRFQSGEGEDFTPWGKGLDFIHAYAAAGNYDAVCEVRDNYGAVSRAVLPLEIEAPRSIPSLPAEIAFPEDGDLCIYQIGNLGTRPFEFSLLCDDPDSLELSPASGRVGLGSQSVAVRLRPVAFGRGGEYSFRVVIDGAETVVKVLAGAAAKAPRACANGPYTCYRGCLLELSAAGSTPGLDDYVWSVPGRELARGQECQVLPELSAGEHELTLALYAGDTLLASTSTVLTVLPLSGRLYLEQAALEGRTVTLSPLVAGGPASGLLRLDYGEGAGWTAWQNFAEGQTFAHEYAAPGSYHLKAQFMTAGEEEGTQTALYFDPADRLRALAAFQGEAARELEVASGETVALDGSGSEGPEGYELFWREEGLNPQVGLLGSPREARTQAGPLTRPGTYHFLLYATAQGRLSCPSVLRVRVAARPSVSADGLLCGQAISNTIYAAGPLAGACITVRANDSLYRACSASNGTFCLEGLPAADSLAVCLSHPDFGSLVTNVPGGASLSLSAPEFQGPGYVSFNVRGARSGMPLEGACVRVADQERQTNAKGKTAAFVLPHGEYLAEISYPGLDTYVTNIVSGSRQLNCEVSLTGPEYVLSGFFYGTGEETVTAGLIQVLCKETQNIVQRYQLDGLPFFDLALGSGKATLRLRPEGYDNENLDIQLEDNLQQDFVLTPEPACALALLALLLAAKRRFRS